MVILIKIGFTLARVAASVTCLVVLLADMVAKRSENGSPIGSSCVVFINVAPLSAFVTVLSKTVVVVLLVALVNCVAISGLLYIS